MQRYQRKRHLVIWVVLAVTLPVGEIIGVVGPVGSGKTTLVNRVLTGGHGRRVVVELRVARGLKGRRLRRPGGRVEHLHRCTSIPRLLLLTSTRMCFNTSSET